MPFKGFNFSNMSLFISLSLVRGSINNLKINDRFVWVRSSIRRLIVGFSSIRVLVALRNLRDIP